MIISFKKCLALHRWVCLIHLDIMGKGEIPRNIKFANDMEMAELLVKVLWDLYQNAGRCITLLIHSAISSLAQKIRTDSLCKQPQSKLTKLSFKKRGNERGKVTQAFIAHVNSPGMSLLYLKNTILTGP